MVRTYWLVPGFNEASDNLDLQPFALNDRVEACRPRAMSLPMVAADTKPTGTRPRQLGQFGSGKSGRLEHENAPRAA